MIDIGCMNGWGEDRPQAYVEHKEKCKTEMTDKFGRTYDMYDMDEVNLGRCYNRYTCKKCGISYTIDSGD